MHYSASAGVISSFSIAQHLPQQGLLWLLARRLLEGAGALFACYLLVAVALFLAGVVWRVRDRRRPATADLTLPQTRPAM